MQLCSNMQPLSFCSLSWYPSTLLLFLSEIQSHPFRGRDSSDCFCQSESTHQLSEHAFGRQVFSSAFKSVANRHAGRYQASSRGERRWATRESWQPIKCTRPTSKHAVTYVKLAVSFLRLPTIQAAFLHQPSSKSAKIY